MSEISQGDFNRPKLRTTTKTPSKAYTQVSLSKLSIICRFFISPDFFEIASLGALRDTILT